MELKRIEHDFTVCKVASEADLSLGKDFYFIGKTDEEISLVCLSEDVPRHTLAREDGNSVVYYFKDATAVISSFGRAPEVIEF